MLSMKVVQVIYIYIFFFSFIDYYLLLFLFLLIAAIKAANSVYNILSNSVNSYLASFEPPTTSSNNMNSNTLSSSHNSPYNRT